MKGERASPFPLTVCAVGSGIEPEGYSRQTVNQCLFCGRLQRTLLTLLDGGQPFAKNNPQVRCILLGAGGGVKT